MAILDSIEKVLKRDGKKIKREMEPSEFRCIHRHSKETHPNCFRRGVIKDFQWWKDKDIKLAFFDIETTDFKANAGFVTCWVIKYRGKKKIYGSRIKREEIYNETFDKRVVADLVEELKNVDVLVSYYGTRFDIPFVRSRAFAHNLYFPPYGTIYHFDLYYRARSLLQLHRNSLDAVTRHLDIPGKTHPHIDEWMSARYGNPKTLKFVWDHCVADVKILEELFYKLEDYSKWTKRSI
jgi:uncharacterized protein YprB with RNaseH-like and TPR domain